jgi:signal transduction histidine kinase
VVICRMMQVEEKMRFFLESNSERMLAQWMDMVVVAEKDTDLIYENGRAMYQLIILYLSKKISEDTIQSLAQKVAYERVQAQANIAEFVWNVSLGRSIIFNHLHETVLQLDELQSTINRINECFDLFLYHAIKTYTDCKDRDLEDKKLLIEQSHKDRLTLLGQMSAVFVHEFRNPLTSVMGFVKLLQQSHPSLNYLDIIQNELQQLNYRITQFLLVSKKNASPKEKEQFSIISLIHEILEFLYPSIVNGRIDINIQTEDCVDFMGYRNEIKQVLLNLIHNGIDALQQVNHPRRMDIVAEAAKDGICLTISNNGPKIPSHLVDAIFEPFISTKDNGTGLGLFVCKQIVENHRGTIECRSSDHCTQFKIHFRV